MNSEQSCETLINVKANNFFIKIKQDKNWKEIKLNSIFKEKGKDLEKNLDIIKMIANDMKDENNGRKGLKIFRRLFNKKKNIFNQTSGTFLGMIGSIIKSNSENNKIKSLPPSKKKINNHSFGSLHRKEILIKDLDESGGINVKGNSSFDSNWNSNYNSNSNSHNIFNNNIKKPRNSVESREKSLKGFVLKRELHNETIAHLDLSKSKIIHKLNLSEIPKSETTLKNLEPDSSVSLITKNNKKPISLNLYKKVDNESSKKSSDISSITNKYMNRLNLIFEDSKQINMNLSRIMTPNIKDNKVLEKSVKMIKDSMRISKTTDNKILHEKYTNNCKTKMNESSNKLMALRLNLLENKSKETSLMGSLNKDKLVRHSTKSKKKKESRDYSSGKNLRGEIEKLNHEIDKKGIFVQKNNGKSKFVSIDPNNIFRVNEVIGAINSKSSVNFKNILENKYDLDFQNYEIFGIKPQVPKYLIQHLELTRLKKQNDNNHLEARKAANTLYHDKNKLYKKFKIKDSSKLSI